MLEEDPEPLPLPQPSGQACHAFQKASTEQLGERQRALPRYFAC